MSSKKKISAKTIDPVQTKLSGEPTLREVPPDAVRVESQSSIEITRGDKGIRFSIKVYHNDPFEASRIAQEIFDELHDKFN